jgi:hypothetical protein
MIARREKKRPNQSVQRMSAAGVCGGSGVLLALIADLYRWADTMPLGLPGGIFGDFSGWVGAEREKAFRVTAIGTA